MPYMAMLPALLFAAASAASPLLGTWAVDVSRLPVRAEARPKSVTFTFTEVDGAKWKTDVDIRGGDGSERRMTSTCALDGSPCTISGDTMEADSAAMKLSQGNVLVIALTKEGAPASTRIYAAAPDARTMIETAVYFTEEGKPVMRTNYFSRVK
jgi:hypothetical protein